MAENMGFKGIRAVVLAAALTLAAASAHAGGYDRGGQHGGHSSYKGGSKGYSRGGHASPGGKYSRRGGKSHYTYKGSTGSGHALDYTPPARNYSTGSSGSGGGYYRNGSRISREGRYRFTFYNRRGSDDTGYGGTKGADSNNHRRDWQDYMDRISAENRRGGAYYVDESTLAYAGYHPGEEALMNIEPAAGPAAATARPAAAVCGNWLRRPGECKTGTTGWQPWMDLYD